MATPLPQSETLKPLNSDAKLKICFVTNMCTHYVLKLFEILAKKYSIDFYFTGGHEWYWEKRNKSFQGDFNGQYLKGIFLSSRFKLTFGLFRIFSKPYDVIIKSIDDRFALPFVFFAAKILKKPFILWTGIWDHPQTSFHKMTTGITHYLYQKSDAIIVYGPHVKKYLTTQGIDANKIFCAMHSVDNRIFDRPVSFEEKDALKKSLGIGDESVVLYIGRMEECKGLRFLAEAMEGLKDKKVYWLFIGEGDQKEELEDRCCLSGLKYKFLNHIPNQELFKYYALADIFVLPSITTESFKEPWGLVINEAMNQGCPVVTTHAVGAAEGGLVVDGQTGFVVDERNSLQLKDAISKILDNRQLKESMSAASRQRIATWGPEETAQGYYDAIAYVQKKRG